MKTKLFFIALLSLVIFVYFKKAVTATSSTIVNPTPTTPYKRTFTGNVIRAFPPNFSNPPAYIGAIAPSPECPAGWTGVKVDVGPTRRAVAGGCDGYTCSCGQCGNAWGSNYRECLTVSSCNACFDLCRIAGTVTTCCFACHTVDRQCTQVGAMWEVGAPTGPIGATFIHCQYLEYAPSTNYP